ncbi:MAG: helix-turn-helix domain-containing protein, partial [Thermodesulfovibrionales bacterium]
MSITIADRIKQIRQHFNLTQQAFARSVGISQSFLSELEKGKTEPSQPLILAICYRYSINKDWLLTGEGNMLGTKQEGETITLTKDRDFIEWAIVKLLREMDEENRREI